jgi:Ca-dependent carbohydrate-binding module xylan-binding
LAFQFPPSNGPIAAQITNNTIYDLTAGGNINTEFDLSAGPSLTQSGNKLVSTYPPRLVSPGGGVGTWGGITPVVTPSTDGTKITTASGNPIIDKSGNAWTLVQSATNGLQIAVNGTVDAPTANVVLLETLNGAMVQENTAGNWYSETTPNDSWTQIANPNPTTPPPAPAIVTGSGSDTLVLSISEDAYANGDGTSDANGDAAFTVSVDGKQLAGTFCATASHSAGASQNFTLKGDWAPGAHTVTVAFLNDAWGGTTSTDRNLYVNDVTYDGTDTKQSAALRSTGSQTFSVTDSSRSSPSRSTASSLAARSPRRRCTPQATARPSPSPLTSDPVSTRSR